MTEAENTVKDIETHFEMMLTPELAYSSGARDDLSVSMRVFRLLSGYENLMLENARLKTENEYLNRKLNREAN